MIATYRSAVRGIICIVVDDGRVAALCFQDGVGVGSMSFNAPIGCFQDPFQHLAVSIGSRTCGVNRGKFLVAVLQLAEELKPGEEFLFYG